MCSNVFLSIYLSIVSIKVKHYNLIYSNLIFPRVRQVKSDTSNIPIDAKCRGLTASFVRNNAKSNPEVQTCQYFEVSHYNIIM